MQRYIPSGMVLRQEMVQVPMQSVLDTQLTGAVVHGSGGNIYGDLADLSKDPNLKAVTFWSKYGFDSATGFKQFHTKDKLDHNSVFSSYLTTVALQATFKDGRPKKNLWKNDMANSPYGVLYLRMALEKEDDGNSFAIYLSLHLLTEMFYGVLR